MLFRPVHIKIKSYEELKKAFDDFVYPVIGDEGYKQFGRKFEYAYAGMRVIGGLETDAEEFETCGYKKYSFIHPKYPMYKTYCDPDDIEELRYLDIVE